MFKVGDYFRSTKALELLFQQTPAAITVLRGKNHVIEYMNDLGRKLHGGQDFTGRTLVEAMPVLAAQGFLKIFDDIFETGKEIHYAEVPAKLIQPDGTELVRHFNVTYKPLRDERQEIIGILSFSIDVTDQVNSKKEVAEVEQRFRQLADSIPQMAWVTDHQGKLIYVNRRWIEYTGAMIEDVANDGGIRFVHPEDRDSVTRNWLRALAESAPFETEFRLLNFQTGEYEWFLCKGLPSHDETGKVVKWFGTNTNIEKQKSARETLVKAVSSRDLFLSVASHELKTPVTSVKMQLQLAAKLLSTATPGHLDIDRAQIAIEKSNKSIDRITTLIDDLLDVTRLDSGHFTCNFQSFCLNDFMEEIENKFRDYLKAQRIDFNVMYPRGLTVEADRVRIDQVLTNLLTNAVRYGEGKPLSLIVREAGQEISFVVQDYGMGIPREKQRLIFERFERLDKTKVGLGLGLYIAKQIVDAHRGKIDVESTVGRGSTFTVTIPRSINVMGLS